MRIELRTVICERAFRAAVPEIRVAVRLAASLHTGVIWVCDRIAGTFTR